MECFPLNKSLVNWINITIKKRFEFWPSIKYVKKEYTRKIFEGGKMEENLEENFFHGRWRKNKIVTDTKYEKKMNET